MDSCLLYVRDYFSGYSTRSTRDSSAPAKSAWVSKLGFPESISYCQVNELDVLVVTD